MDSQRSAPIVNRTPNAALTAVGPAASAKTTAPTNSTPAAALHTTSEARSDAHGSVLHRMMTARTLQPKLKVGSANDPAERDADNAAELAMAAQTNERVVNITPRNDGAFGEELSGDAAAEIERLRASSGTALAGPLRLMFEPRFGYDFGRVRVHTDSEAARAAASLQARAFTLGNHLFFAPGEYQPDNKQAQRLIAHELAHVVQTGGRESEIVRRRAIETWEVAGVRLFRTISREVIELPEDMTAEQVAKLEDDALAAEKRTAALPRAKPIPEVRKPSPKPVKIDLPKPARRPKRNTRAPQPKLATVATALLKAVGKGKVAQFLAIKGAPALTKGAAKLGQLSAHEQTHEDGAEKRRKSEDAVVIPASDEQSKANLGQVSVVAERAEPVVDARVGQARLTESLNANVPRSIGALDNFERDKVAQHTSADVLEVVQDSKNDVVKTFGDVRIAPAPIPSNHDAVPLPPAEKAPPTPQLNLARDTIAPLEKEHTDLSGYTKEADAKLKEEGVTQEQLDLVDRGDLAEANKEKKGMAKRAITEPAAALKMAQDERLRIDKELTQDEHAERRTMESRRDSTLKTTGKKQSDAKLALEKKRDDVAREINLRYKTTQDKVNRRLTALETESLKRFDDGNAAASKDFEASVNRELDAYKDDRYSGWFGWARKAKDWLLGMDDLPAVKAIFERNREAFVQRVSKLVADISADGARVVQECKDELTATRASIQKFVDDLDPALQDVGKKSAAEMSEKLDDLDKTIGKREEELQNKLKDKQTAAIKAIDEKIEKMKEDMSGALAKVGRLLLLAAKKFFSWALESFGVSLSTIESIINKGVAVLKAIFTGPIQFVKNLIAAAKLGFQNFAANFLKHLKDAVFEWLTGELQGIQLPETWNARGVVSVLFQAIGISWENVKSRLVLLIPASVVETLESKFGLVKTLISDGPMAAWEQIKDMAGELRDGFIRSVTEWIRNTVIVQAVKYVLALFIPGAGMVKAIFAIYDTVVFFIQKARDIIQMIGSFLGSIADIAAGKIQTAADALENGLARGLKLVIVFLAKLLKLDGISAKIRQVLHAMREKVNTVLDRIAAWIVKQAKSFVGGVKKVAGKILDWWRGKKPFHTADGEDHEVGFQGEESSAELFVFSTPRKMALFFSQWETGIKSAGSGVDKTAQTKALGDARAKYADIKEQQKELNGRVAKGVDDPAREAKVATLLANLGTLAALLAKHNLGKTPPLPPTVFPPFVMGVRAPKHFKASYISKSVVGKGTVPGSSQPKSWDIVQLHRLSDSSKWVRMHLLTAQLGGQGVDSNLVPAPGPVTNIAFRDGVEHPARDAVMGTGPDAEPMIWYSVDVAFREDDEDEFGRGFPSNIDIQWGGYEAKQNAWVEKPTNAKNGRFNRPVGRPDLYEIDSRLKINLEGRTRVKAVLKITDREAMDLVSMRKTLKFDNKRNLIARAKALKPELAAKLEKSLSDASLVTYSMDG